MTGGSITGGVSGGLGDDLFILRKGQVEISDGFGEGNDTLRTAISYVSDISNEIETIILTGKKNINFVGDQSSNTVTGNRGDNRIDGYYGDDVLTGGRGRDTFVFGRFGGGDHITDFTRKQDRIELAFEGVDSFRDLVLQQVGKDVVIDMGNNDILTIEGRT